MGQDVNASSVTRNRKSMTINHSQISNYDNNGNESKRYDKHDLMPPKIPNAQVNEGKLKMILQQLKKVDRNVLHTSR